jgi:hypothetical protein
MFRLLASLREDVLAGCVPWRAPELDAEQPQMNSHGLREKPKTIFIGEQVRVTSLAALAADFKTAAPYTSLGKEKVRDAYTGQVR